MILPDLAGKACLVTGASRGIGAAVAPGFGAQKANVAVHYRSGRAEAEAVAAAIAAAGGRAVLVQGDVAEPGTMERLVEETRAAFGRLDILVNNAGDQIARKTIEEADEAFFELQDAINMRSVFAACRHAARVFKAQGGGGSIINVTSIAARTGGGVGSSVYAGAKAFVSTFTRSLAKELASDGIRVNAVSPGVIATDLQARVTPPEQLEPVIAQIPMKRAGSPEECVGTFLYLASDTLSGYVTGQIVEVNGGLLMP